MDSGRFDLVLAGGGLAAGLVALALRPRGVRTAIVEAGPAFGGNHLWSSFATDLSPAGQKLAAPLIAHRWDGHDVRFPAFTRHFTGAYQTATSERLDRALAEALPADCRFTGATVVETGPGHVQLADGRRLKAGAVVDARGERRTAALDLGFQLFVGLDLELARPHGLVHPVIMDATVDQQDGYRFVYLLPFAPRRVLVEDTYYTDAPQLDRARIEARIHAYVRAMGWEPARTLRTEEGVLPIALGGDIGRHLDAFPGGVAPIGLAAALFHPLTGYSFPDAVDTALLVAGLPDLSGPALAAALRAHAVRRWHERGFYRLLARMLFRAAAPDQRWRVLQRFYGLDAGLVARFFAGHSSPADKLRLVAGRPPVPLGRALAVLWR